MAARNWNIIGYDGAEPVFKWAAPEASLSESEMTILLQRLASRHLSDEEITHASLRKSAKDYRPDLEIKKNQGGRYSLMTMGSNWHYSATIDGD